MESQLGTTVRFKCACGHTSPPLTYASRAFAESDREAQEAGQCLACIYGMSPEELERRAQLARAQSFEMSEHQQLLA